LKPRCSCPDSATPCKHAAAVCYLVAEALDDDPFLLFTLRGRTKEALLAELRAHRQGLGPAALDDGLDPDAEALAALVAAGPQGEGADPGVPAREAWTWEATALPPLPDVPARPGTPAAWPADPPPDAPFDTPGLLI